MIGFNLEGRIRFWSKMSPKFLLPLCFLFLSWVCVCMCESQDDFICHTGGGLTFNGEATEQGAIFPRGDIIVEVGNESKEVLCRFNSSFIKAKDVYFDTKEVQLPPHKIVNRSTISIEIGHLEPKKYTLYCMLRKKERPDKHLCSQVVTAGYPPLEPVNYTCKSNDNVNLNCSWEKPYNPLTTFYSHPNFSTPMYLKESCPSTNKPFYTWCLWDSPEKFKLRDKFDIIIVATNKLGSKTFEYSVNVPETVIPNKISAQVSLVGPVRAKVDWNLSYPIDVFYYGLWHNVEYRIKEMHKWENVTYFFYQHPLKELKPERMFSVEIVLPYAYTDYEFRVRIHTGAGEIKENMWSDYDILSITTEPLPPIVAPKTSLSTFEVVEMLDFREIYVNFQDVDKKYYGGDDFKYSMKVYSAQSTIPIVIEPTDKTNAYFKYKAMNFTEYRFEINAANEKGQGNVYSEVVVPDSDCMPKKTEMFDVFSTSTATGKAFNLYWLPSKMPNKNCSGSGSNIDSYTIFWCKKTFGDRCKERLFWKEIGNPELVMKDLRGRTDSDVIIYEKNITDLLDKEIYSFGVAATTGGYSSGIKWSSCIGDETEAPLAPVTVVESLNNDSCAVLVKWSLKCNALSAVPLGFNISYCKSDFPDFGHCTSKVLHVKVNSPAFTEVIVSNLDPGFSYIFSVAVLSLIGEGRQSVPKMIILRDEVPSAPPMNFTVVSTTNTSVSFSWKPPSLLQRRVRITEYQISIECKMNGDMKIVSVDAINFTGDTFQYTLKGLQPFSSYSINITSCTKAGCGYKFSSHLAIKTKAGVPPMVDNFDLDVSNWKLNWDLKKCYSRNCSFEVLIPVNETDLKVVPVLDKETLSLRELKLDCNYTEMTFFIRAKGQDDAGHTLYGNMTSYVKNASDCPPALISWWVICLITSVCVIITVSVLFIMKCGWSAIMKAIKDCRQKINLPKGIQEPETSKDMNIFSRDDGGNFEPSYLLPQPSASSSALADTLLRDTISTKQSRESVSSEEVQLIDASDHDRHGRNLSGSSEHSSGQDSALMSIGDTDVDANSSELGFCPQQETTLRQRSPFPPYVHHGIIPEKLPEGYVTARSVPSLPHLYKDAFGSMQQLTPEMNPSILMLGWQNARRASTGYISMPDSDSDKESPGMKDLTESSLSRLTPMMRVPGLPSYSRHSFNPDLKLDTSLKLTPLTGTHAGYVTLAEGPNRSPSPPSTGNDLFGSLKRPPSLPLIPKSYTVGELPLRAYCHVGSRGNPASQGYVSASHIQGIPSLQNPIQVSPKNPYVTCGEAALLTTINKPLNDVTTSFSRNPAYVELSDDGHWAHPVQHPIPYNQRPPTLCSTPTDGNREGRVGQLPRPNTTEATMGHRKKDGNPSLSKQSSGYVSQETIPPCEAVVMSPKRLLSQASAPHTIVMSPSHQASMV